jgi:hypothetical protein
VVYCDNVSAIYLSQNPVHHRRTKHVELDIHFVREKVALGQLRVLHVPTHLQYADIMTKGLPTSIFEDFCSSLCISADARIEGAACGKRPCNGVTESIGTTESFSLITLHAILVCRLCLLLVYKYQVNDQWNVCIHSTKPTEA